MNDPSNAEWVAMNDRRLEMIHKKYREGLDEAETLELARLTVETDRRFHARRESRLDEIDRAVADAKALRARDRDGMGAASDDG